MSRPPTAAGGINKPNGIALSPDERHLIISEYGGTRAWRFEVGENGGLVAGERWGTLSTPENRQDSGGDGMIADKSGRYYVTSHTGIQVFDPAGRLIGLIEKPGSKACVSAAFAGRDGEWLYLCASDKVFRRKAVAD